ncbi:MAG: fdrA domain protein [Firmicutes bacterium]|nr:fdrA domain protein [Bacillota bacterium]
MSTLFREQLKVINLGLLNFADSLKAKGVEVVHVRWSPPAQGDENLLSLLDKLK